MGAPAPAPPRAEKKIFRPSLHEKCVSAPPGHEVHPQPEQESKKVVNSFGKKCTPGQNPGTPMRSSYSLVASSVDPDQ